MPLSRDWVKSSHSEPNGGNCIQARHPSTGQVQVRDSKDPDGPILTFTPDDWTTFTAHIRTS